MSYQIEISPPVQREIRQLPGYIRAQAIRLIDTLVHNPRPARARELRDRENIFRIWLAGRWRIVYAVDDDQRLVLILRVRRKEDIDYSSL